jgi:hypothetical protein
MSGHYNRLSTKIVLYGVFHDEGSDMDIDSTQDIVVKIDVAVRIERTCEIHSELLTS